MPPTLVPQRLRELIAALDRRLPQPLRRGESAIQHDATALRAQASARLSALVSPVTRPTIAREWHRVARGHNALLVGTPADTTAAVGRLLPRLRQVVVRRKPGQALDLTDTSCRTLIIEDAGTLSVCDQRRLGVWLDARDRGVQVVSTAGQPLYPLVERGAFDAALYYRLNVLCVDVPGAD